MDEKLKIIDHIPEGFWEIQPSEITTLINNPTLIHLRGKEDQPFFVSVLLHGNEYSGLLILQNILKKYRDQILPRSLIVFVANPKACAKGVRHLEDQPDFNRIWKGGSSYEELLVKPVLQYVKDHQIQGAIDIHNNTGRNPIYACINKRKEEFVKLAQVFSVNIVYFTKPDTVLSKALSEICPAVVLECGLPGHIQGIDSGVHLIENILDVEEKWKQNKVKENSIYHTYATLYIAPDSHLSFHPEPFLKDKGLCFIKEWDKLNFKQLQAGTFLGKVSDSKQIKLIDHQGKNIFDQFFSIIENNLTVKTAFIPGMLTQDIQVAQSDCLGYVMEKIPLDLDG